MKKTARKKYIALCLLAAGLLGRFWYSKQALQKVKETVSFAQSFGQQLILQMTGILFAQQFPRTHKIPPRAPSE